MNLPFHWWWKHMNLKFQVYLQISMSIFLIKFQFQSNHTISNWSDLWKRLLCLKMISPHHFTYPKNVWKHQLNLKTQSCEIELYNCLMGFDKLMINAKPVFFVGKQTKRFPQHGMVKRCDCDCLQKNIKKGCTIYFNNVILRLVMVIRIPDQKIYTMFVFISFVGRYVGINKFNILLQMIHEMCKDLWMCGMMWWEHVETFSRQTNDRSTTKNVNMLF